MFGNETVNFNVRNDKYRLGRCVRSRKLQIRVHGHKYDERRNIF
jgi:hypothetical protein